ncbi:hypothetical protein ACMYR3_06085 [Ampullimonas aquatilis]|uniref:hypothetical protein n=1 Tax=Ampullimonas aquatilis TaxID=1341549 RepID=UPI003C71C46D
MFKKIILNLISTGLSEREIAVLVGMSQPTINRIKLGKQDGVSISYSLGTRLLELHKERLPGIDLPPNTEFSEGDNEH